MQELGQFSKTIHRSLTDLYATRSTYVHKGRRESCVQLETNKQTMPDMALAQYGGEAVTTVSYCWWSKRRSKEEVQVTRVHTCQHYHTSPKCKGHWFVFIIHAPVTKWKHTSSALYSLCMPSANQCRKTLLLAKVRIATKYNFTRLRLI